MEIESLEIFQYLAACDPLSSLEKSSQKKIALSIEIVYVKRGQIILQAGTSNEWLYLIRSGAVERTDPDGTIAARFGEKDFFGHASLQRQGLIKRQVKAIEDTLLYRIPKNLFFDLLASNGYFQFYFKRGNNKQHDFQQQQPIAHFNAIPVSELLHDGLHTVDHKVSVTECAKIMQDSGLTSLLVTQKDQIKGIITDRAFCTKVVADKLSYESPVGLIMSDQLLSIDHQAAAAEALLLMARHNIRHLPVRCDTGYLGVLTATDLIHRQSNNPIYLINQIYKTTDLEKLIKHAEQIPETLCRLVRNGFSAKDTAYSISSIGRAINRQLIKLAEKQLGPAPINYAWIIAGSLARNDQTGRSDQDNGLILADNYDEELHAEYFLQLSRLVCDGLNLCGYVYCPGDVMATNNQWRQPLKVWKNYFQQWIVTPEPKALMFASIFFDLNSIHGENELLNELNQFIKGLVVENKRFLNFMAHNALQFTPPLGLFRSFVLEKQGSEEKSLNLKKRGVVPITDLARVYALACGAGVISTHERLRTAFEHKALSQPGLMDLTDAFEFLSTIRLNHQAKQIEKGLAADNFLLPETLSSLERRHLKDTFEIIRTYQKALESSYQISIMG